MVPYRKIVHRTVNRTFTALILTSKGNVMSTKLYLRLKERKERGKEEERKKKGRKERKTDYRKEQSTICKRRAPSVSDFEANLERDAFLG
eukprot:556687-Pelagomonas_calceolata.AAC.1